MVSKKSKKNFFLLFLIPGKSRHGIGKLEDLTVLKRSPDLLNNVKIGQDQLRLIMKHILFYGGCGHFGLVNEYSIKQPNDF